MQHLYSEQNSATYFHSTDQRTLAESILFTMKCVKMSGDKKLSGFLTFEVVNYCM